MDLLGIICNLAISLGLMFMASKKMFQSVKLLHSMGFGVASYIVMPIPTIGVGLSIVVLVTCLLKWSDATGVEVVGFAMVSLIIAPSLVI